MAKEGYVGKDSDKVFAEVCENCHGQNGIGGEVKEVESVMSQKNSEKGGQSPQ